MIQPPHGKSDMPMRQAVFEIDGMDDRHKAEKIIADFATAFSLDVDYARETETSEETKWPMSLAIVFAVSISLVMWGALTALFYFL